MNICAILAARALCGNGFAATPATRQQRQYSRQRQRVIHRDLCSCQSRRYWLVTNGCCSFAESASIPAGQARLFRSAELDPTVLTAQAERVDKSSAGIDFARLSYLIALLIGQSGQEHLSLSDGRQWLRIDILLERGSSRYFLL
jgi:hypothetical protein